MKVVELLHLPSQACAIEPGGILRGSRHYHAAGLEYAIFVELDGPETQSPSAGEAGSGNGLSTAPAPSSHAGIRQIPGPGPQVEHHPALRQAQEPDGATPCPPASSARSCRSGCTPTGWKCTTRTIWWNGWSGCGVSGRPTSNYRHVIGSLVHKPGAFARYRFREQLFPAMQFRLSL